MEYVIPGKKRRNGKRSPYRGRFRLTPLEKFKEVPLHTTDRRIAQKRLREIVQELQDERAGFIRPKKQREAVQRAVSEHIEAFIAERYAVGRDEKYVRELKKSWRPWLRSAGGSLLPISRRRVSVRGAAGKPNHRRLLTSIYLLSADC